jgi:hypothetical protein
MTLLFFPLARVARFLLPRQLRCGLSGLPRGLVAVARAAHRAQPSDPPSRATELAQSGVRTLAVSRPRAARSCSTSVSTRGSGRSVPARVGAIAPIARGADFTSTPRFPVHLHPLDALARVLAPSAEPPSRPAAAKAGRSCIHLRRDDEGSAIAHWVGGGDSARRVAKPSRRSERGPRRAGRGGETAQRLRADAAGTRAGQRCRVARAAVASEANARSHPPGKQEKARQLEEYEATPGLILACVWRRLTAEAAAGKRSQRPHRTECGEDGERHVVARQEQRRARGGDGWATHEMSKDQRHESHGERLPD